MVQTKTAQDADVRQPRSIDGPSTSARISADLHAQLLEPAERDTGSFNGEVTLLQQAVRPGFERCPDCLKAPH
jgi:hypothetical protein